MFYKREGWLLVHDMSKGRGICEGMLCLLPIFCFLKKDLPFPNFLNQLVFLHCVFRKKKLLLIYFKNYHSSPPSHYLTANVELLSTKMKSSHLRRDSTTSVSSLRSMRGGGVFGVSSLVKVNIDEVEEE